MKNIKKSCEYCGCTRRQKHKKDCFLRRFIRFGGEIKNAELLLTKNQGDKKEVKNDNY